MAYGIQHLLFSGGVVLSLPFCRLLSLSASLLLRYSAASDAAPLVGGYLQTLSVEMVTLPLNLSPLPSCVAEEICDGAIRSRACMSCPLAGTTGSQEGAVGKGWGFPANMRRTDVRSSRRIRLLVTLGKLRDCRCSCDVIMEGIY